jgi:hypothetical protein
MCFTITMSHDFKILFYVNLYLINCLRSERDLASSLLWLLLFVWTIDVRQ